MRLTGDEQRLFEAEVRQVPEEERERVMELTTSWKEEGIEEGLAKGREEGRRQAAQLVLRQLARRFGDLPAPTQAKVGSLSHGDLEELAVALLDFQTGHHLEHWLATRHSA